MEEYLIITFESTNYAMQTESFLKDQKLLHQIIPTPREITLSCGLSIRTSIDKYDLLQDHIKSGRIRNKSLYKVKGSIGNRSFEELKL